MKRVIKLIAMALLVASCCSCMQRIDAGHEGIKVNLMMFSFITIIISFLVFYLLVFKSKLQSKTRRSYNEYWTSIPWEDATDGKKLIPIWKLIVFPILCLIPGVNILFITFFIAYFSNQHCQYNYGNCGMQLTVYRWHYESKLLNWLKKEKEI